LKDKLVDADGHRANHNGVELLVKRVALGGTDVNNLPLQVCARASDLRCHPGERTVVQLANALKSDFKLKGILEGSGIVEHFNVE
jgi:hypothetical protein